MSVDTHELERIHQGLTLCAAQTSPHQVVLAEGSMRQVRIDKSDPTPVPYGYQQKLERIGHQIGFPVYYEPDPVDRSTGQGVHGYTCPGDQFGFRSPHIMIDSNSSPASKFRVTVHELTHAIIICNMEPWQISDQENEMVAESVAGIVCGWLRTSNGKFSSRRLLSYADFDPSNLSRVRPLAVHIAHLILQEFEGRN